MAERNQLTEKIKMTKKLLMGLGAVLVVVAGVAAMSAYEAHVINVTAHIENALYVHPDGIDFGTVFPQEYVERQFTVELSSSFQAAERVDDVEYVIKQKPKCECDLWDPELTKEENEIYCPEGRYLPVDYAAHSCPEGYTEMESLCPFLSKMDADPEDNNDTSHPSYYNDNDTPEDLSDDFCTTPVRYDNELVFSSGGWAGWSCPLGSIAVGGGYSEGATVAQSGIFKEGVTMGPYTWPNFAGYTYSDGEEGFILQNDDDSETIWYYVDCLAINPDATGLLTKDDSDFMDLWTVDLKVPPVEGYVGQDWPAGCPTVPKNDVDYGCDLWVEVTHVSEGEAIPQ